MNKFLTGVMVAVGLMVLPSAAAAHEPDAAGQKPAKAVERLSAEEKKAKLRQRMEYLKENHPEAYRRAMAKLREKRHERLEWLKENRPEAYEKVIAERREKVKERLGELREKNPEKYGEMMKRRQAWKDKGLPPPVQPDLKRRMHERFHDRDNNPPGPRGGAGTNWENPPGPKGGPGVGPNRRSGHHPDRGVRDHGQGQGRGGVGRGGEHRSPRSHGAVRRGGPGGGHGGPRGGAVRSR